jgi:hypothetical protein
MTWKNRIAIAAMMAAIALPAQGQGKSKGAEKKAEKPVVVKTAKPKDTKVITTTSKGEVVTDKKTAKAVDKVAKKRVTTSQAVIVTRDVLVANGYQVVNVVPTGATQVIYYRRGNRGNGRGLGPVERIVVVPAGEVVRFTSVPEPLLATILRRLGM